MFLPDVFPLTTGGAIVAHGASLTVLDAQGHEVTTQMLSSPLAAVAHNPRGFLAACTQGKELIVWRLDVTATAAPWAEILRLSTPRCASAAVFDELAVRLVFADKTGDAYLVALDSVPQPTSVGEPILGNISMLLCLSITADGKQLIVGNRDEKIRISAFPRAWNIDSFCLGHRAFVTSVCLSAVHPTVLVSGSGDGTVRSWNIATGQQTSVISVDEAVKAARVDVAQCIVRGLTLHGEHVVVTVDGLAHVLVLHLDAVGALSVSFVAAVGTLCCAARFDGATGALWILSSGPDAVRVYDICAGALVRRPLVGTMAALEDAEVTVQSVVTPHADHPTNDGVAIYFSKKEERLRVACVKKDAKRVCAASVEQ